MTFLRLNTTSLIFAELWAALEGMAEGSIVKICTQYFKSRHLETFWILQTCWESIELDPRCV